ncbi:MAG: hypothetical protein IK052_00155 [Bacteroidales bacterium]|nr:hypothetical protein [Bacteroidales bacterium]
MKKTAVILLSVALLAGVSCSSGGKYPLPEEEKPKPEQPEDNPPEDPGDEPGDEPEDPPVDVTLMEAFEESFDSNSPLENLVMDKTSDGYDFRYFPGFPSLTENGTKILMMRLSLTDSAGKGPSVTTKDYVHYGSYAVRMRLPDVTSVQAKLGARVEFGPKGLALGINLSSPTVGEYNAASKFYIYGIDWSADKLSYWVKTSATADKKVIEEITENVPDKPQKLALKYYHNDGQAPNYPYELEIDWIQYNPS